jgi:hypothetical protein
MADDHARARERGGRVVYPCGSPAQEIDLVASVYFEPYTRRHALSLVAAYSRGFTSRVLAAFDNMESEAEAASEAYFEKKMDEPAWDDSESDESDIAEAAEDHGISVYADL